jgi:hypothetical protein
MTADVTTPLTVSSGTGTSDAGTSGAATSGAPPSDAPPSDAPPSDAVSTGVVSTGVGTAEVGTGLARLRSLATVPRLAALGLYVAAGGHLIASLVHLSHGWGITAFFLVMAGIQVVAAGRLARGVGGSATAAVLAVTLGLVLLYLASRTVTLPFGGVHTVHNDRPQDPDLLGTVVLAAELLTLATGPALLPATVRRWAMNTMLLIGAGLWLAWGTGLL